MTVEVVHSDSVSVSEAASPVVSQFTVHTVPQLFVHVEVGGPVVNLVVGALLSGGQSILMRPKRLRHVGVGIGGRLGKVGQGSSGNAGLGLLKIWESVIDSEKW